MAVCGTASLKSLRHVYLRREMNKFHVRNTELAHPPVRKKVPKENAFSAMFQDNEHLESIIRLCMNYNWTLLSTREPAHKEIIFCKMNLKLEKLC